MSGKIFLISDSHFGHKNIIKYCNRPFDNVEDMNSILIKNWNSVVDNEDYVYHLGDFGLGTKDELIAIGNKLNGHKILVMGNHDHMSKTAYKECGFDEVYENPVLIQNPKCHLPDGINKLLLSHEPVNLGNNDDILNIHGHLHGCKKYYGVNCENHIDVFYSLYPRPMRLSEIIEFFKSGKYDGLTNISVLARRSITSS